MSRPQAVPVWTRVATDSEWSGSKWVSEEERADGLLRLEPTGLVLEVEVVLSTTTVDGMGESTDTEELGRRELEIPFEQVVSMSLHGRWWRPRIRVQTNSLSALEGLPGAKRGVVDLRLSRRHRADARALMAEMEFARADLELRLASRVGETDPAPLPPR